MSFSVAPECVRLGLRAGAILFRRLRVAPAEAELRGEIARACAAIQARFATAAAIRACVEVGGFQEVLRQVGVNPRREQSSVERLLHYAFKRGNLPSINNLVDAYNLVSIRAHCSLGAHDLDRSALPVSLRILSGDESFVPLGGAVEVPVRAGEFGYVDANDRVLCRLDVVQAEFSKVTAQTVNAMLIIEATAAHSPSVVRQTFDDAVEWIQRFCGGTAEIAALPDP